MRDVAPKTENIHPGNVFTASTLYEALLGSIRVRNAAHLREPCIERRSRAVDENKSFVIDQSGPGPISYIDGGIGTSIDCSPKAHLGAVTAKKCLFEPSRGIRREV